VFIAITLPWFILKTAFMWLFFFKKPDEMYIEWCGSVTRHIRSNTYPSRPVPKMRFVDICKSPNIIENEDNDGNVILSIKNTPFFWFSIVMIPVFCFSSLCLLTWEIETIHGKLSLLQHQLIFCLGILMFSIWSVFFSVKIFYRNMLDRINEQEHCDP
jgi:hypothetical protein